MIRRQGLLALAPRGALPLERGGLGLRPVTGRVQLGGLERELLERGACGTQLLIQRGAPAAGRGDRVEMAQQPRPRLLQLPLEALDGARPVVFVLLSPLPCRHRIPLVNLFLRDLGDHGAQPRFLSRQTRRQRLDLAAGIVDAGLEVAGLFPPRTQALLDPFDLEVEGVHLLPPPARGGFTLLELQPQPFEVGLVGGQTRQRGHLLHPQRLQRRHARPAIVVEGKQPPPRQGQASLLELFDETLVAPGLARLPPEGMDLLVHLHHDVVDAEQVGLRGLKLHLGLPPLRLVSEDPRGLLEHGPPVLRPGSQHLVDLSLFDRGVQAGADVGFRQQILDVLQSAARAVEDVFALPGAVDPARDHDFLGDLLDTGDRQRSRGLAVHRRRDRHGVIVAVGRCCRFHPRATVIGADLGVPGPRAVPVPVAAPFGPRQDVLEVE